MPGSSDRRRLNPEPGGQHLPPPAGVARGPDALREDLPPADAAAHRFENLQSVMRQQSYAARVGRFLVECERRIRLFVPGVAKALGAGPWERRFADPAELAAGLAKAVDAPLGRWFGFTPVGFAATAEPLERMPEFGPVAPRCPAPFQGRSFVLDCRAREMKHLAGAYFFLQMHQYTIEMAAALADFDGTVGEFEDQLRLPYEVAKVWHENLTQAYFDPEAHPIQFEQQPVRAFAASVKRTFQRLGWGSY